MKRYLFPSPYFKGEIPVEYPDTRKSYMDLYTARVCSLMLAQR